MIEPKHLLFKVIRPTLKALDLWSVPAERLVLGTAMQESACGRYLIQLGGPALGIYQMEPATHDDIWNNFLLYNSKLVDKLKQLMIADWAQSEEVIGNLYYATAMCRVHYLRVKSAIPDHLHGQADYWKAYYNTPLGKGTTADYLNNWQQFNGSMILQDV